MLLMLLMKTVANNTMYTVQELHFFYNHLELNYKSFYLDVFFSHQYFHYILQLIYQLTFFYSYSFYNPIFSNIT